MPLEFRGFREILVLLPFLLLLPLLLSLPLVLVLLLLFMTLLSLSYFALFISSSRSRYSQSCFVVLCAYRVGY